jgi:hypothetical protein
MLLFQLSGHGNPKNDSSAQQRSAVFLLDINPIKS